MGPPEIVTPQEELGRSVSAQSSAARARRSAVPYHEFLPPKGERNISVDRLSVATSAELVQIADDRYRDMPDRNFYGWAVVVTRDADSDARNVVSSPITDVNPFHADIVLPGEVAENRQEQKRHAQKLRDLSRWRERPGAT